MTRRLGRTRFSEAASALPARCAAIALALALAACGGGDDDTSSSTPSYNPARDTVQVTGGTIVAAADSSASMRVFKAIPFAAAPVGNLRWKPPQPVPPWTGIRRNDSFAPACYKGDRPPGRIGAILYQTSEPSSEDCLYLNVWTAATGAAERRPVMLYVYGGGFLLGSGSQPHYNGAGLASKGAVVVTMNYRLGPLGFLAHPELTAESANASSGNYALQDVIAALQWVQANAAAFGGDASKVTVYSESAGAVMASALLASPLARGLVHRMMLASLGNMPTETPNTSLAQAEAAGRTFATNLGATSLAAMRARLPQEILATAGSINGPIVDGWVVTDQLDLAFAGKRFHDIPLLLGWNADEGTPYAPFATTLAGYNAAANTRFGALADRFRQVYPASSDADVLAMAYDPMRDGTFAWQPWTTARAHAANGTANTYLYFFTRRPPYYPDQRFTELDPPSRYGAYHTLAQVYFNNNLDLSAPPRPYEETDRRIASAASSYLVNFARNGDPNGDGLPVWPVFNGRGDRTMVLGDTIGAGSVPFLPALDFYDAFYASRLGRPLPF